MVEPVDGPEEPESPSRRKLLIGGGVIAGFAAANVVLLRGLNDKRTSSPAAASRVKVVNEPAPPPGPPALDGAQAASADHVFDRVITGGRVIDPETGYDQVANVGIDGNRITSISTDALTGQAQIDATGLVVSPGFIDVLSYEPNDYGDWFKVADGVTANLCMHGINNTPDGFFGSYESEGRRPPIHYGGAFDDPHMRSVVAKIPTKAASQSQIDTLVSEAQDGFTGGWLGVDIEPEYTPWVTADEIDALARVAAGVGTPLFSHIRYSSPGTPTEGSLAAIDELLKVATDTGVAVHVDHITSMATHVMDQAIAKMDDARSQGIDVTACLYPYDFWATTLASQRFSDGWQERFGISYGDLEVAGTGERLTEKTFPKYQARNTLVAAYAIPESDVQAALRAPWTLIGSDAILETGNNNHPRSTGCFSRTLGTYVRDKQILTLNEALSKMTIQPAKRLEARCSTLRRKGRLQIGADADITVFDPATISDTSTVENPAQQSVGVRYVMVMGQLVKDGDTISKDVRPGQPVKSDTV